MSRLFSRLLISNQRRLLNRLLAAHKINRINFATDHSQNAVLTASNGDSKTNLKLARCRIRRREEAAAKAAKWRQQWNGQHLCISASGQAGPTPLRCNRTISDFALRRRSRSQHLRSQRAPSPPARNEPPSDSFHGLGKRSGKLPGPASLAGRGSTTSLNNRTSP